jgi:hypothetical protein
MLVSSVQSLQARAAAGGIKGATALRISSTQDQGQAKSENKRGKKAADMKGICVGRWNAKDRNSRGSGIQTPRCRTKEETAVLVSSTKK